MFQAALKNLLGHKLRMFLTGFSIILGVSFVAGTYIFTDSIGSTFDNLFKDVYAGIDVSVRPAKPEFGVGALSFDESVLDIVKSVDGVSAAAGGAGGVAQFLDADGNPIGGQGPPTIGASWAEESGLNVLRIVEGGRAPEANGEVLVDKATADKNDFKVGDTVKIVTLKPAQEFKIVGVATFGESDGLGGATLAVFSLAQAQELFNLPGKLSEISVKAQSGISPEELRDRIDSKLPEEVEAITGQEQTNESVSEINEGLGFINTALLAFAGIAIFVGSFIIQNTFRIIVAQRAKELALLRAMGATKVQVVRLVIYEALAVSILSSIAGIFMGMLVSSGVRNLMNVVGFSLPKGPLTVEPRTIIVSILVGVVVTLVSALLPAIKASRVSPVEALQENEGGGRKRKSLFKRGLIGTLITVFGAGALAYGLNGSLEQPIYLVGFGVFAMFIGVSIVAPLLSVPIARLVGWPLVKTRGIPARLARDNARRTPRRTASTAAALMIGVSLVTMLSVMATTFKSEITRLLADSFPADLIIQSTNIGDAGPGTAGISVEALNDFEQVKGLEDVTAFRYAFQSVKVDGDILDFFIGADSESLDKVMKLGASEQAMKDFAKGAVLISENVSKKSNVKAGDTITFEFAQTGEKTLPVAGIFTEPFDSEYIVNTAVYLDTVKDDSVTWIAASIADGQDEAAVKTEAEKALAGYPQLDVQDKGELFDTAEKQIDQVLGLFWGLLGFAVIIAVLGITNTLMLSISERTRELGMLRAIGMVRSQMRRMIRYESIIIALFGAVLGVSMGAFFAWVLLRALKDQGISGYVFPTGQVIIYFILAIFAGILAAAWPARKAARMDVLKAIYHE